MANCEGHTPSCLHQEGGRSKDRESERQRVLFRDGVLSLHISPHTIFLHRGNLSLDLSNRKNKASYSAGVGYIPHSSAGPIAT